MASETVRQSNPEVQVYCFTSGEALLAAYAFFAVVFLDIDMQGIAAIETGRRIRKKDYETKIIYLTSYRDYVAGAFEVHAFQYLLKPVSPAQLTQILEEIFRYLKEPDNRMILDFHTNEGLVCVDAAKICYFEFIDRKIRMVTVNPYLTYCTKMPGSFTQSPILLTMYFGLR